MNNKTTIAAALLILSVLLTGCWNRVEIDERNFVLAVAVDKPLSPLEQPPGSAQGTSQQGTDQQGGSGQGGGGATGSDYEKQEPPPEDQVPRYAVTLEVPVVKNLQGGGGGGQGGGGGGGGQQPATTLSTTGNTLWEAEKNLNLRYSRQNTYGHLKVIVISEDIAREGLYDILDFFARRREVPERTQVAIANGEARKAIQIDPLNQSFAAEKIEVILMKQQRTGSKLNEDLLEVRRTLTASGNAVMPRIRAASPADLTVGGSAVIKGWKFVGWLSGNETSGLNLIRGEVPGGSLTVPDPEKTGLVSMRVRSFKSKLDVELVENQPVFSQEIWTELEIVENESPNILWNDALLKQIGSNVELELEHSMLAVMDKLQAEFAADVVGFGDLVSKKHPKYWSKVKEKWDDEIFPDARYDVDFSAEIRRVGLTR